MRPEVESLGRLMALSLSLPRIQYLVPINVLIQALPGLRSEYTRPDSCKYDARHFTFSHEILVPRWPIESPLFSGLLTTVLREEMGLHICKCTLQNDL